MHPFLNDVNDKAVTAETLAQTAQTAANTAQSSAMATPSRIRFARVAIPSILGNALGVISVTWLTPFTDLNYTICTTVETINALIQVQSITNRTTTGATFSVKNIGLTAQVGMLHVIAIHD